MVIGRLTSGSIFSSHPVPSRCAQSQTRSPSLSFCLCLSLFASPFLPSLVVCDAGVVNSRTLAWAAWRRREGQGAQVRSIYALFFPLCRSCCHSAQTWVLSLCLVKLCSEWHIHFKCVCISVPLLGSIPSVQFNQQPEQSDATEIAIQ